MQEAVAKRMGPPVLLKNLKKKDFMIEYDLGTYLLVVLIEDPIKIESRRYEVQTKDVISGKNIKYLQDLDHLSYGPRIYEYKTNIEE